MTLVTIDAKNDRLRDRLQGAAGVALQAGLDERLDASWIYHDAAIEGVVLGHADVQAAMAEGEIPAEGLSPAVPEGRLLRTAIKTAREMASRRKRPDALEVIRRFYTAVTPEAGGKATLYRRDNPLHRLYFHEIVSPERIGQHMKRLVSWLDGANAARLHPILRASRAHYELLRIFPWTRNSGRVARLLMNYILLCEHHQPAVIHATDRQRYYESLRVLSSQPGEDEDEASQLTEIVVEAMDNGLDSALRFVEEAARDGRRLRAAS
jgi:Fic family protein